MRKEGIIPTFDHWALGQPGAGGACAANQRSNDDTVSSTTSVDCNEEKSVVCACHGEKVTDYYSGPKLNS